MTNVDVAGVKVFASGVFKNQSFLSVDLEQLIKYNHAIIDKVHEVAFFEKNIDNPFAACVQELFDERTAFKKKNPAIADAIKLILNSLYGKQVQKPETKAYKIVSSLHAKNMTDSVESVVTFGDKYLIVSKAKPGK